MNPNVVVLPMAVLDLGEQADYLAGVAGLETALRFNDRAATTFRAIVRTPGIGEPWRSRNLRLAGLRTRRIDGFPNDVAFYRTVEGGVEIVRVLHGSRDIEAALVAGQE
jgi:toxin ParE1/3/4